MCGAINICMDCGCEWDEDNAMMCRKCGSGDFYTYTEEDENEGNKKSI